ncbi:hypothetical protein [Synechococcus sp. MIT S9507]|uniref:hypothetical protein n=1 Tax=Synechococcus sp. MIT S9507 TaxID=3082544 RepID=UPI0039B6B080
MQRSVAAADRAQEIRIASGKEVAAENELADSPQLRGRRKTEVLQLSGALLDALDLEVERAQFRLNLAQQSPERIGHRDRVLQALVENICGLIAILQRLC